MDKKEISINIIQNLRKERRPKWACKGKMKIIKNSILQKAATVVLTMMLAATCFAFMGVSASAREENPYAKISAKQENIKVSPGENVTLETVTDTNVSVDKLHYKWSVWENNEWVDISNATDTSYTLENVTKDVSYCCDLSYDTVDEDGDPDTGDGGYIIFSVMVEYSVSFDAKQEDLTVIPGSNVTLETVLKTDVPEDRLHYKWTVSKDGEDVVIDGATDPTYTLENVSETATYTCDLYYDEVDENGDVETEWGGSAEFYVTVDNNLSVEIISSKNDIIYGDTVTLTAKGSAGNTTGLTYTWYLDVESSNEKGYVEIGTGPVLKKTVMKKSTYRVEVADAYGNTNFAWITIFGSNAKKNTATNNSTKKNTVTTTTSKGITYKVSGAAVSVTKCKTAKSATIPGTITVNGKKVKVTAIADSAFNGNKKLTSVTIGKNVKTIGKKAFYGCTKLKKVTIKSKSLKKIGTAAFKKAGVKKITVKTPAGKKKAYKKMLKKAGLRKTAAVK